VNEAAFIASCAEHVVIGNETAKQSFGARCPHAPQDGVETCRERLRAKLIPSLSGTACSIDGLRRGLAAPGIPGVRHRQGRSAGRWFVENRSTSVRHGGQKTS